MNKSIKGYIIEPLMNGNKTKRDEATKLRKRGKSYNEIRCLTGIAKSTLSLWLRNLKIGQKQRIRLLKRSSSSGINALIKRNKEQTTHARLRAKVTSENAAQDVEVMDLEKLKIIGCSLYFGEGGKTPNRVDFTNSDPRMIVVMMRFFRQVCKVKEEKFRVQLSLHSEPLKNHAVSYWSRITGISEQQFIKVNLKVSDYSKRLRRKKLPFGTIQIRIADVKLFHTIQGWTNGILMQIEKMPG